MALIVTGCARPDEPQRITRPDIFLALDVQRIESRVPRNATLDGLLRQHELPSALVHAAVESVRGVFDPRQLRADRPYRLVQSVDGFLREFEYEILGASLLANGREYQAFRWVNPTSGKAGYYDEEGRSLKRVFLRSPLRLDAPRITSRFSLARRHPVHRVVRPHLGVDYGVPTGTPVVAVADGTVVSAGWAGGGGNQLRLRHAGNIETYYLHLSRFAKGMRAGTRVTQGQLIGYVGATGTATGPHLDYRFKRNGVFLNPLTAHGQQPSGEPIPSSLLPNFRGQRDAYLTQLSDVLPAEAATRPAVARAVQ